MSNLNKLTLVEAVCGLSQKKFSVLELVRDCLNKIQKENNELHTFITVIEKEALAQAKDIDYRISQNKDLFITHPLLGIPVCIKDNFCTLGIRTTAASKVLENYIPVYDATVVKKLKEAGAVIIGKTNMDAWAHGSSTESSDFFTTLNPWDNTKLPGGSSGGSAASVAADETIFSVGSETAGSIRQPAAWCGVVGLKPTYGRVSRYGLISMASSTDSPGPITKNVEDAAVVLKVIAGPDNYDATASLSKVPDYVKDLQTFKKGMVIGIAEDYFKTADSEVAGKIQDSIKVFQKLGAKIVKIKLFDPSYAIAVYTILQRSEVSSNLARFDGIRYGNSRNFFGWEAKRRIMLGTYCLSAGYFDEYYTKAQKIRTLIKEDFDKVFAKIDVIVAPTAPSTALPIGSSLNHPMFGEVADVLVEPSTIAGLPGISINAGFSKKGLPIGMQIVGPKFSETLILQAAYAFEKNVVNF